jgi:hypothetical protein
MHRLAGHGRWRILSHQRKKTAAAIRREVARAIDQLLRVILAERRNRGHLHPEAIERAVRSALPHAGAPLAAFSQPEPPNRAPSLALAAVGLNTQNGAPGRSSRRAPSKYRVPITLVHTVITGHCPPTSNSTSRTRRFLPESSQASHRGTGESLGSGTQTTRRSGVDHPGWGGAPRRPWGKTSAGESRPRFRTPGSGTCR